MENGLNKGDAFGSFFALTIINSCDLGMIESEREEIEESLRSDHNFELHIREMLTSPIIPNPVKSLLRDMLKVCGDPDNLGE